MVEPKLKPNEEAVFNYLKEQDTPIELSAKEIGENIQFSKPKLIRKRTFWSPSRQAVLKALHKLQKDGLITLDFSNRTRPRIIMNGKGVTCE